MISFGQKLNLAGSSLEVAARVVSFLEGMMTVEQARSVYVSATNTGVPLLVVAVSDGNRVAIGKPSTWDGGVKVYYGAYSDFDSITIHPKDTNQYKSFERTESAAAWVHEYLFGSNFVNTPEGNWEITRREVIALLLEYGGEAAHHQTWAIDQALRRLAGDEYEAIVRGRGWDIGIAP